MPRDLFDDVTARRPAVRSRRSPLLVVSVALHAVVLVAVLAATSIAPGMLPTPREALAFYEPARLIDIQLPPPAPVAPQAAVQSEAPTVSPEAAPVVAPSAITPETWSPPVERTDHAVVTGIATGIGRDIAVGAAPAPAPAPSPPPAPVRLHSGIAAPQKIVNVLPVYPEVARTARLGGVVILEAVIDATGVVSSARVLRGHPVLDPAALDAVRQWRFTPARLNGEPIPVVMTVTVRFALE